MNRLAGILAAAFALASVPLAFAAGNPAAPAQKDTENHVAHAESRAGKSASWTAFPILKIRMSGEIRERRVIRVISQGIVANRIDAYSSDVNGTAWHRQLVFDLAGAKLEKQLIGGFHWLAAREELDGRVLVASTVHYSTERSAQNPTAMFMRQKHELEIIPQPYPREHSRYRANESWKFLVRFNGKPLVEQKVHVETANGTHTELSSDTRGMVTLVMPDDFMDAKNKNSAHDHGRRGADFVLATEHAEGGISYLTAFNASYGPDAFDQRSLALGLGFTLLGMFGAAPLLRQRKTAKAGTETTKNEDA